MKQQGIILWLTGLSGAGKTTIAHGVAQELLLRNYALEVLDGDVVRTHLSQGLGFSKQDRDTNVRRIGFVAELLSRNGIIAIVAAISPYREIRDELKKTSTNFVEVYVKAPLTVCELRDEKGLYAKAKAGEIKHFTGISDPYEEPLNPEIICQTDKFTIEQCVNRVINYLEHKNFIVADKKSHANLITISHKDMI
ncbi:MAG: adenylyl-sulfate kinase [Nostoc sp. ChiSLP02]|nr:adenylyl-sulfate kinase [Nostoc sp. DedSLP05]MDZ8099274.1 adenylyl-sulfate kinase [Nostoc sp. DedSLP01]MDZ8185308.1 adenylyl-sulfate kinase [Nostoc sp. ChiSLP02]